MRHDVGVPTPKGRSKATRAVAGIGAGKQVAVVDRDLAGAVFIRPAIEEGDVKACLHNGLAVEFVSKSKAGAKVTPVDIGSRVSCTTGAIAELGGRAGSTACAGLVPGLLGSKNTIRLLFSVNGTWISQRTSDIEGEPVLSLISS